MGMVYQWKSGSVASVSAQIAGEAFERIRVEHNGRLTQEDVVNEAKSEDSPLHPAFEWDNEKAAHQWRLEQAGYMIRHLVVSMETSEGEKRPAVRAFVNVERDRDRSYTSLAHAMSDEELRSQVVNKAWAELESWRRRYEELSEFAKLFIVIDRQMTKRTA